MKSRCAGRNFPVQKSADKADESSKNKRNSRKGAPISTTVGGVSEPRYKPRDFCAEPESFGKAQSVQWLPVENVRSLAFSRAARLQHLYAVRIRARAKAIARGQVELRDGLPLALLPGENPKGALKKLADESGTSYARLLRCLRGEVVMRLDDLAWADLVLGEISEQARTVRPPSTPTRHGNQPPHR